MAWLGLDLTKGRSQSDNAAAYDNARNCFDRSGYLYYCDCSSAALEARKAPGRLRATTVFVVIEEWSAVPRRRCAFRTPREGRHIVHDLVRGDVEFANALIEDFVVVKSSGDVLYALANVTTIDTTE